MVAPRTRSVAAAVVVAATAGIVVALEAAAVVLEAAEVAVVVLAVVLRRADALPLPKALAPSSSSLLLGSFLPYGSVLQV